MTPEEAKKIQELALAAAEDLRARMREWRKDWPEFAEWTYDNSRYIAANVDRIDHNHLLVKLPSANESAANKPLELCTNPSELPFSQAEHILSKMKERVA